MSAARTLSGNIVFSCVPNQFIFTKVEAGGAERYTTSPATISKYKRNLVPAAGIERYAPTDNTQLIEKVRTQEPHNPLYARLLCTKSCTTKSVAAALLVSLLPGSDNNLKLLRISAADPGGIGKASGDGARYHMTMQFGGTVLYVDEVSPVVDFYRRVFGLELRFFDETLGFAELETGGSTLAIAAHSLGEKLMPNRYERPADGRPAGIEIAFLTRDVPASFAKAIAEGATPITAPRRMPWGLEVAYVRAPEGTLIGFSEPPAVTK